MHDPDVIALVDGDTGHLPEYPVVGQRLGPEWIDLKKRNASDLLRARRIGDDGSRSCCGVPIGRDDTR
jgi:hypothetical protein